MARDSKTLIFNAATPTCMGFYGDEKMDLIEKGIFTDVGIAEENAMAMTSGAAKNGATVVYGTYGNFLQRTYDQLSHDLCLNNNPATILVVSPGIFGFNSNTHLGIWDIHLFTSVPNLIYLDPASVEEYNAMLKFATSQKAHPVAIRVINQLQSSGEIDNTDYSVYNKFKVKQRGKKVALISTGPIFSIAKETCQQLKDEGIEITLISPGFLSGLDEQLLTSLQLDHDYVVTIEDGQVDGGFGQKISAFYGMGNMKVKNLGISKKFHSDFKPYEILAEHGISKDSLVSLIKDLYNK